MNANTSTVAKIISFIGIVNQRQGTGRLVLTSDKRHWHLYFFRGHLFYATSDIYRIPRWYRALKRHCSDFNPELLFTDEPWEYQLLNLGITQNKISSHQALNIIETSALEVLFDLLSHSEPISSRWQIKPPIDIPLALIPSQITFQKAQQQWDQWQNKGLGEISPNFVPILTQSISKQDSHESTFKLIQLLDSQNTIWDIAYQLGQPAWVVTLSLLTLVRKGLVEFKAGSELPKTIFQNYPFLQTSSVSSNYQPLIACIDDSPMVGHFLEKILIPAGYRLLKIIEPLREMAILVEEKPDLIFLDLVMPEINGYSLCSLFRKNPAFENTPIIILTGRDNVVARSQAKFTGATDFLKKPPEAEKLLHIVEKYLPKKEVQPLQAIEVRGSMLTLKPSF